MKRKRHTIDTRCSVSAVQAVAEATGLNAAQVGRLVHLLDTLGYPRDWAYKHADVWQLRQLAYQVISQLEWPPLILGQAMVCTHSAGGTWHGWQAVSGWRSTTTQSLRSFSPGRPLRCVPTTSFCTCMMQALAAANAQAAALGK